MMKLLLMATVLFFAALSFADQSAAEKSKVVGHNTERTVKKAVHRVTEKFCTDSDVKCLAKKAGNRIEEGKDASKDKILETKDIVDKD